MPAGGGGAAPGTAASALEAVLDQGVRATARQEAISGKMYWLYEYDEASPTDDEHDADRETGPELHYLMA